MIGKKINPGQKSGILFVQSDRSGDFTGTHTPGTNIHMAGGTVDDCLHTLHVGLPGTIGTTMRVGDLNAESNALIAELALSHPLHLLAVAYFYAFFIGTADIITEKKMDCKNFFKKITVFFVFFQGMYRTHLLPFRWAETGESIAKKENLIYNKTDYKYLFKSAK